MAALKHMTNHPTPRRIFCAGVAGGLLCLAGLAPALAEDSTGLETPLVLGRRQATHLLVNQVSPEYPPLARVNYIQGLVSMEVVVSREGHVARAHVLRGNAILAAAALRAVRRWLYRPLVTAKGPVAFLTTVNMIFTLRNRKPDQFPLQPESDMARQVKPPEVLNRVLDPACTSLVHMRVLLDDQGEVIDTDPLRGPVSQFEEARRAVEQWTFGAARWGTLRLPWYLEVDVPVTDPAVRSPAADPSGP
jgi:TonB family protein